MCQISGTENERVQSDESQIIRIENHWFNEHLIVDNSLVMTVVISIRREWDKSMASIYECIID